MKTVVTNALLLAELIGLKTTILYAELIDYAVRLEQQGLYPEDGWMELSIPDIQTIGFTSSEQKVNITKLVELNLLFCKEENEKRYLRLNPDDKVLEKLINDSEQSRKNKKNKASSRKKTSKKKEVA